MSTPRKIILQSADKQEFEVNEDIAMEFNAVKSFFQENPDASVDAPVPILNVSSKSLSSIIEYCQFHLRFRNRPSSSSVDDEAKANNEKLKAYDEEFVRAQDNESLKEMMLAAHDLDIKDLFDLLAKAVAERIENKSAQYVRRYFGIENDYTAEEEAEIMAQNKWAFEGFVPDDDD